MPTSVDEVDRADGERARRRNERDPELAGVVDRAGGEARHAARAEAAPREVDLDQSVAEAEPLVDGAHPLVTGLRPGLDALDAVPRRPGELGALERGREAAAPPVAPHDGEPVLRDTVLGRPAQARVADDLAVGERDERAARIRRLVAQPVVERDRDRDGRRHVRPAGRAEVMRRRAAARGAPRSRRTSHRAAGRRAARRRASSRICSSWRFTSSNPYRPAKASEPASLPTTWEPSAMRSRARAGGRRGGGAGRADASAPRVAAARAARRCRAWARPTGLRSRSRRAVSPAEARGGTGAAASRSRRSRCARARPARPA